MISIEPEFKATTGKAPIFWTILAENDTKTTMESTMFQRNMAVVVPEFGSLVISVVVGILIATMISVTAAFRTRL